MKCNKCGTRLPVSTDVCPVCGERIIPIPEHLTTPAQAEPPHPRKRRVSPLLISVIVILIAACLFDYLRGNSNPATTPAILPAWPVSGHTDRISSLKFTSDGKYMFSESFEGGLKLHDGVTGRAIQNIESNGRKYYTCAISPDGSFFVANSALDMKIWSLEPVREIRSIAQWNPNVTDVDPSITLMAVSPDGNNLLVSCSYMSGSTIELWDTTTGRNPQTRLGGNGAGLALCFDFSSDSQYMLTGHDDGTVRLSEVRTGNEIERFDGHKWFLRFVAYSPDESTAISGSADNTIKMWDVKSGKEIGTFVGHTNWAESAVFSPDGKFLISGSIDGTIKFWDIDTRREILSHELTGHDSSITAVAISPDGERAFSGDENGNIKLWDLKDDIEKLPSIVAEWSDENPDDSIRTFTGHSDVVNSAAFTPDGLNVVSGCADGTINLWDVNTGFLVRKFSGQGGYIASIAVSPDGSCVISGSLDGILRLWDLNTGNEIRTITEPMSSQYYAEPIHSVAFSPDGLSILSAGEWDATLWETGTGNEIRTIGDRYHILNSVAISPDGQFALLASTYTLSLADMVSGAEILDFAAPRMTLPLSVAFSPDGSRALMGGLDGSVTSWDVSDGTRIAALTGHSGYVASVAYSPDGNYAASGSVDGTIKLWDLNAGGEIRTLRGHNGCVESVDVSPDGRYIISGGTDHTLKLWDLGIR